jgi:Skp family chaperone for outer membrane proteins
MKYLSLALSVLALIGVTVLFFKNGKTSKPKAVVMTKDATGKEVIASGSRIAFNDSDTLEEHNTYFQKKKKDIEQQDAANQAQLKKECGSLESEMASFQQRIQAGNIDQKEGEATRDRLIAKQGALDKKREGMGTSLEKQTDEFREAWSEKVREKAQTYAEENGFDAVMLGNKSTNGVIYYKEDLNITEDMIKIMEEAGEITPKPKSK